MINNKQCNFLQRYSIKNKLIMISLIVSSFGLLIIGIGMTMTEVSIIKKNMLKELTVQAKIIGDNSTASLAFDDPKSANEALSALKANTTIDYCILYTKEGKPFARYSNIDEHKHPLIPYSKMEPNRFGFDHVSVYQEIILDGKVIGGIYIQSNLDEMYDNLFHHGLFLLLAFFVALLGSYAVSQKLQNTITAPIIHMADLMQRVSEKKNYAIRTPIESHDELGQLAEGFNEMLSQIQARDTELEQHREHLEQEVAQRTIRLTEAQRIAHLGNWEWDITNNKLEWSDEIYRIFGLTPQQFGGTYEAFQYAIHPEDRQTVDMDVHATLEQAGHRPHSIDHRILLPNGTIRHVHEQGELFCDKDGQPIKMVGTVQDITERKQAEQALEESERKFRAILDSAVDGILMADAQTHKFVSANRAICDMLGYKPKELYRLGLEDIHPAESLDYVRQQFERQLKGEIRIALNLPVKRKDGSLFFADVSSAPLILAQKHYLVGIFHDVTERSKAEEKIRKLNEELEEKVKERTQQLLAAQEELVRKEKLSVLGQVAGSVGHELRNPLGVMNNAVYFLQTILPDADESVKEYLDIIKNEIAGSERIVSDLLDSVRTKPPQTELVGVIELIEQTLRKLNIPSSVTLNLEIPETLPPLQVDGQQIHQVLRNLISNGVEAMPDGGTLDIRAVSDEAANTIILSVHDSGIGMTPEHLSKLFQPLFTTKARGIGLGLVVVKNLTEANGGTITVESEAGRGTRFTLTLPSEDKIKGVL